MRWLLKIAPGLAMLTLAVSQTGYGQPPAAGEEQVADGGFADDEAVAADSGARPNSAAEIGRVPEHRRGIERDLAELGRIAERARRDLDAIRLACVTDKLDRAEGVTALATPEIALVAQEGVGEASRALAAGKVAASAQELRKLVDEARACTASGPGGGDGDVDNGVDAGEELPATAPTASSGFGPGDVPPIDPTRSPTASPVR